MYYEENSLLVKRTRVIFLVDRHLIQNKKFYGNVSFTFLWELDVSDTTLMSGCFI